MLEPCAGKLASTVLRGGGHRKMIALLDLRVDEIAKMALFYFAVMIIVGLSLRANFKEVFHEVY